MYEKSSDKIKEIECSPYLKGIRGTDKRKYIIDTLRLNPRDPNYPDP